MHSDTGMGLIGALGSRYAAQYKQAHPWTQKTGRALNEAAFKWQGGSTSYNDPKPDDWMSREEMQTQIGDLNKRYDALKIDYDKLSKQRAPNVFASHAGWRDEAGGYGSQDTNVDNVKIAKEKAKTTTKKQPQVPQTYTGSASL